MSRPFRHLLPAVFIASALSFAGCVGTIYDHTYSNRKNYFKPQDEDIKKEGSAETILGALDKDKAPDASALPPADAAGLPPADVPGLPPAGLPAPDAGLPAPAAPPAPAVPPPAK